MIYASQVYPEAPAAFGVAVGLLAATSPRAHPLIVAGCAAALPWLGSKYALLSLIVFGVFAWRHRRDRRALILATAPVVLLAGHYVWWHLHTFDGLTPYSTNVVYAGNDSLTIVNLHVNQGGRSYRLYGLFLDARFGLFRWLPIAPLALWGITRRTLLPAAVVLSTVLVGTFVSITMMGWWFPGRMLVAGLPALTVLVAIGAARFPKIAVVLGAWGIAIAAFTAWSAHHHGIRLAVDPWTVGFPLAWQQLFPDFRGFGAPQVLRSLAWGIALAIARSIAVNGKALTPRRQLARLPSLLRPAD